MGLEKLSASNEQVGLVFSTTVVKGVKTGTFTQLDKNLFRKKNPSIIFIVIFSGFTETNQLLSIQTLFHTYKIGQVMMFFFV